MIITLPDELAARATQKAIELGFGNVAEFLTNWASEEDDFDPDWEPHIPENMRFRNREELELRLREGLESGTVQVTPEMMKEIRARIERRAEVA